MLKIPIFRTDKRDRIDKPDYSMDKIIKYEGLVAAPFTPMDSEGNLDTGIVEEYYHFLEKNGVAGAFINGTTGEGASLTQKEKQTHAAAWAQCLKDGGKVRVINLVGGTSYKECIENAIFSKEVGMSAIAVIAPYFFKPADVKSLVEFVVRVGESVPEMPVYFYHIPIFTDVSLKMSDFLKEISGRLPNFAGIKFSHEDLMDFITCLSYRNGRYDILWGRDECLLAALALGCKGAVGSTYNYAAPLYISLIGAFMKGDLDTARKLQQKSVEMIGLLGKYGGVGTGKAYMKYIGMDCGEYRLPVKNIDSEMFERFAGDVKQLDIDKMLSVK